MFKNFKVFFINNYKIKLFYGTPLFKRILQSIIFVICMSIFSPVNTKLQGVNFSLTEIAIIGCLVSFAGYSQRIFKDVHIKKLFIVTIFALCILDIAFYLRALDIVTDYHVVIMLALWLLIDAPLYNNVTNKLMTSVSIIFKKEYEDFLISKSQISFLFGFIGSLIIIFFSNLDIGIICLILGNLASITIILEILFMSDFVRLVELSRKNYKVIKRYKRIYFKNRRSL